MELLNNQITREQGVHSPRQSYWSFALYLLAENLSVDTTVLDFPSWKEFTRELKKGYTHVGISFIVPNVLKVKRMAEYIRQYHPETKIILGGYGTVIPELEEMVPYDEACQGDGVRWLREYFGEDTEAPIVHPPIEGPAYASIYGFSSKPKGGILLPGLGCENGCDFCITSHKFNNCYVPFLKTGKDIFDVCRKSEEEMKASGFSIMDENFLKHPVRARQLLVEMEKNQKPYVFDIFSSAEAIKSVGVDFLVRMGIHLLWIGVESKASVYSKTKGIDLRALIEELQSKGIVVCASTILFQEHHDEKTLHEDIDWVISLGADLTQFMNYSPFPSTALYKKFKNEGRLRKVDYRHQHGAGELLFEHPHFKDKKIHLQYLRDAFRKKYEVDGPGVLNMALTAIRGYKKAREDYLEREKNGMSWNPETLRYEKCENPETDEFMKLRIQKMQKIAMNVRLILLPAMVYAPNRAAREKAKEAIKLFDEILGKKLTIKERASSYVLVMTGALESAMIMGAKLKGQECTIHQPPSMRKEYLNSIVQKLGVSEPLLETLKVDKVGVGPS